MGLAHDLRLVPRGAVGSDLRAPQGSDQSVPWTFSHTPIIALGALAGRLREGRFGGKALEWRWMEKFCWAVTDPDSSRWCWGLGVNDEPNFRFRVTFP